MAVAEQGGVAIQNAVAYRKMQDLISAQEQHKPDTT
jgi:hypothetical protein